MSYSLDDHPLEHPCPECGATVRTTLGQARRNQSITCPDGHTIEVDGSDLDRETRKVEQAVDKLLRGL